MNKILVENEVLDINKDQTIYLSNNVKQINITHSNVEIYSYNIDKSLDLTINLMTKNSQVKLYLSTINYNDNNIKVVVNHKESNTNSDLIIHGVNVKENKLNFNITGVIPKTKEKCICNQSNMIINMKDGKSTILPILLIDNYDCIANHSAYIGKFKDEEIFYLMSRGLSRKSSYELLIKSFLIGDTANTDKIKYFIEEINNI